MNNESLNYLKSIIISQLLLETNETLAHTNRYKQNIKQQTNRLNKMLESVVMEEFDNIYGVDAKMTTKIMNKIESLVNKIATYQMEELILLDTIIDKYNENKEYFLDKEGKNALKVD